jgi:large subunit ribosomal protein L33
LAVNRFLIVKGLDMASKKQVVELIALQCSECKRRNYTTSKNRRNTQEKLELKKYCPFDRKHTVHKETKVK